MVTINSLPKAHQEEEKTNYGEQHTLQTNQSKTKQPASTSPTKNSQYL